MGWYYGFKPYVSVAERRRKAARELESRRKKGHAVSPVTIEGRAIALTFWGKSWCENLESYSDFENRLPRGRAYVRNGSVVHLEIKAGKISALVSGSSLYTVEITIEALQENHWKCVKSECAGQIGSLVELLQGRLSQSVMGVVTRRDGGLFPKPAEIKMKCSCPDWAGMCKHLAAVMYGVGARLDQQPELLFVLRQVNHLELIDAGVDATPIAQARDKRGKKTINTTELADVFGIELASEHPASPQDSHVAEDHSMPGRKPKASASRMNKAKRATPVAKAATAPRTKKANAKVVAKSTLAGKPSKPAKRAAREAPSVVKPKRAAMPSRRKRSATAT